MGTEYMNNKTKGFNRRRCISVSNNLYKVLEKIIDEQIERRSNKNEYRNRNEQ